MAKERKYRFYEKPNSKSGVFSVLLAAVSVVLFLAALIVSTAMRGSGGLAVGALGLIAFLLSVYGFILGLKSLTEKEVSNRYCIIGSIGCGVMSVIWLTVFLTGVG